MNNGMKVISVISLFAVAALLVQTSYAYNQTNNTRMKIYVTNLTITRFYSSSAVENQIPAPSYSQEVRQPNLTGLLIVMIAASLIILMIAKMLSRTKKSRRKHKPKFSKRQGR